MGKASFQMSFEFLVEAMRLPEGTKILGMRQAPDDFKLNRWSNRIEVQVESPGLPNVPEGSAMPTCHPQFYDTWDGANFVSWDIDDKP